MGTNGNTAVAVQTKPVVEPRPSRMALGGVVKGRIAKPIRVLLYGVEGIGKSTFAACAPSPIFMGAEDGTSELDVARFPQPQHWFDALEGIQHLTVDAHEYKTLVIDTLDWLEPFCWQAVCERANVTTIEDFGFGKGYNAALDEWRVFLGRLERLRQVKSMNVIMLAHSWVKSFKNPEGDDYDRYEMKLHGKTAGLLKEWCDVVLFANYETFTKKGKGKADRAKATDSGARVVHSQRRAAWDAKNRYDLPEDLPLDWSTFFEAVGAHRPGAPAFYRTQITENLAYVSDKVADKVRRSVVVAADDAAELARIADKLAGMIQTGEKTL